MELKRLREELSSPSFRGFYLELRRRHEMLLPFPNPLDLIAFFHSDSPAYEARDAILGALVGEYQAHRSGPADRRDISVSLRALGRPTCSEALVTLWFLFPDRRSRDLDNYLATGSKLVGDAIKGRFIPDDSPRHLKGWRFLFEMDWENPGTIVEIEEVGGGLSQRHRDRGEAAGERPKEGIEITRPKCKNYDACSAPLCPLDEQSLENGLWYPDEEVCTLKKYSGLLWIRNQKRLIKKAGRADRHFTLEMLNRNCIIRRGIEGLDPDAPEGVQLRWWLKAHPERRDLSKEDREKMTQRLAAAKR